MGNICVEQGKYAKAIKMYRMALDQIPDVHKVVRLKILQNIGIVFVKMGRYADAITSFEHIMEEKPNFKTGIIIIIVVQAESSLCSLPTSTQLFSVVMYLVMQFHIQ